MKQTGTIEIPTKLSLNIRSAPKLHFRPARKEKPRAMLVARGFRFQA
jgi:hypothetical protein